MFVCVSMFAVSTLTRLIIINRNQVIPKLFRMKNSAKIQIFNISVHVINSLHGSKILTISIIRVKDQRNGVRYLAVRVSVRKGFGRISSVSTIV